MANGLFAGGNGTAGAPFLVEDADDLNAMRRNLSAHYKLINDINLGVAPYSEGEGWNPIDNFIGVLDGNQHTIYNLYINRFLRDNVGLFGAAAQPRWATTFRVYDLALENINIIGNKYVGSLIGSFTATGSGDYYYHANPNYSDMITRVQCAGNIKGSDYIGSIMGHFSDSQSDHANDGVLGGNLITNCVTMCRLQATSNSGHIGGIVGYLAQNENHGWSWTSIEGCLAFNTFEKPNGAKDSWSIADSNYRWAKYANTKADSVLLNGNQITGNTSTATTEQLKSADYSLLAYWYNLRINGRNVFHIEKGHYPQLGFVNRNCYFVRTKKGDYLTYDKASNKWTKQFGMTLPATSKVRALGMRDIALLDVKVWDLLKDEGEVEIINFLPQRNVVTTKRMAERMTYDKEASKDSIIRRKTFNFADYGDEIMNISPVI